MATANVWLEEVEKGLKKEILSSVTHLNNIGKRVSLTDEQVWVRDPEEEFREESYPCVTITYIDSQYDPRRWSIEPIKIREDKKNNVVVMQDPSVPYNLIYQIDFWARYKEDINELTKTWFQKHNRAFNLTVVDDGGVKRSCNVNQYENPKTADLIRVGKRLYHTIVSYIIWVELDENLDYNIPMVAVVDIDAKE